MANEDISKLPKWAKDRLAHQAGAIIELKKQIEELKGEFRSGTRILRSGPGRDGDIPIGDAHDRIAFYTKFYDPESHLDGGKFEVYIDEYEGGLSVRSTDSIFVRPSAANSILIFDAPYNKLRDA